LLIELLDREIEHAVEHFREVAVRNPVAEQTLGMAKLVVDVLADRDVEGEALGRDRCDLSARSGWC
jgi:hypothetical protein